jgi:EAL domain-containing protein (putative c-di-GMP-specific phosphodiesterase class I)
LITFNLNQHVKGIQGAISLDEKDGEQHFIVAMEGVSYVVLIDHASNPNPMNAMQSIAERLSQTVEFREMAIDTGCIAGTTSYPEQGQDAPTLLRNAQIAMEMSNRLGRLVTEYSDAINPYNARRLTLAGELRKAVELGTLELYFQPKMETRKGLVTGMEALLRWKHPDFGMVPPDEFIPIAERTGIIHSLTKWVIDRALLYMVQLQNLGKPLSVAVNISAINLKERNFPETVRALLKRHDVAPQLLSLEVTETSMMDDPALALEALHKLNKLGVRLSIDDFGTGYSSLSYIRKLPVQEIKIDRSFVMEMDTQENDAIIVQTTVDMCHSMGFEVVAEGVETGSSLERLSQMGCDYLQGYHLSRPLPFDELVKFINRPPAV